MKQKDNHSAKRKDIFSSKGFYAALAFCLMASGAASWLAVESSVQDTPLQPPSSVASSETPVNRPTSNVEKPPSSSSPVAPPSSEKEESSSSAPSHAAPSGNSEAVLFLKPASGEIFRVFSGGELVKSETLGDWRTHDGIDIDCEDDRIVRAAGAGVVTEVKKDPLWGTCIEISHNGGLITYYYSLAEDTAVEKGQKVEAGDPIGNASDSAALEVLDPIHVHFAAKKDGVWIDPSTLFASNS